MVRNSDSSKRDYSFGLGLTFIPLSFAAGLTNDHPWFALFIGIIVALIIEWIRYKKRQQV